VERIVPGLDYAATLADWFDADLACSHGVSVDEECQICDAEIDDEDSAKPADCADCGVCLLGAVAIIDR
jgi:hypothetical protein